MRNHGSPMRWLRLTVPAAVLAAWWVGSVAQQPAAPPAGTPPASTPTPPRTPPAGTPPASTPRPVTPAEQPKEGEKPAAAGDDAADSASGVSEELQPDAAVTFPVDI
jgi:hypothetical protein